VTADPDSPVGRNLAHWRRSTINPETGRPYTQMRVADELGVIKRTIQKWELNESMPAWKYLRMLADLYGTNVASFVVPLEDDNGSEDAA
jgi:transcriptional regulator with XRE-family HTH domain